MAINIPIFTAFSDAGIKKAQAAFSSMQKLGVAAFAGLAAASAAATAALGKAVAAAVEDQASQAQLAKTLTNTTGATRFAVAETEKFIGKMQFATGIADSQLRPALGNLARATGDVTKAQELLGLAMDISAATGNDLETVSLALAKAQNGNLGALTRLGVPLDQNIIKTKDFTKATEELAKTFGGAAEAAANTFQGRLARVRVAFDELVESVGYAILDLPVVRDAIAKLPGAAQAAADAIGTKGMGGAFKVFLQNMGIVGLEVDKFTANVALQFAKMTHASMRGLRALSVGLISLIPDFRRDMGEVEQRIKNLEGEIAGLDKQIADYSANMDKAAGAMSWFDAKARELLQGSLPSMGDEANPDNPRGAGGKVKRFSELVRDGLGEALQKAQTGLEDAKQAFADFAQSVSESITSALNFGDAQDAGKETGKGFLQGLRDQVAGIANYASKVRELLRMGLSQQALQQVLDAGQEAGIAIADQLIAGGATAIAETNQLVDSAKAAGDEIGLMAAQNFMQAGIDAAKHMVDGITQKLKEMTPKLMAQMDNIAAKMKRTVNIDVVVTERVNRIIAGIPAMANGGIVTGPTLALIGEAGPEAVVPLSQMGKMGGGVTVNVTGGLATGPEIGEAVVNAIRAYNRTSGPAAIAVA